MFILTLLISGFCLCIFLNVFCIHFGLLSFLSFQFYILYILKHEKNLPIFTFILNLFIFPFLPYLFNFYIYISIFLALFIFAVRLICLKYCIHRVTIKRSLSYFSVREQYPTRCPNYFLVSYSESSSEHSYDYIKYMNW